MKDKRAGVLLVFCLEVVSCGVGEEHICDLTKQLDFRHVGDIEGEWRTESGYSPFSIDEKGHMLGDEFGCAHGKYPVVLGDYNTVYDGLGSTKRRLVQAEIEPGRFSLSYKDGSGKHKSTFVVRGEILEPGVMNLSFHSKYILHRWRPGDDEPTGTTMTSTSEGTDVSSTGTTSEPEETTTSDTGTEADSGTEGSGI